MEACCLLFPELVDRLVNTDGAPFHEHRIKEVTFALNPSALHRHVSLSAGERADTSLPHNIMQKLDCFDFLLSHTVHAIYSPVPAPSNQGIFLNIQIRLFLFFIYLFIYFLQ